MINSKIKYSTLFLFLLSLNFQQLSAWTYSEESIDLEGRAALMATVGRWNPYVEIKGQYHGDDKQFRYTSLSIGTYFKMTDSLKLGAFYRLQSGARHLEDWQFDAGPPDTQWWIDSRGRFEHLLYFDATPRILLPRLPGKTWVAPLKVRYFYNMTNGDHNLLIRPGITFVIMPNREPLLNLTFNYNLYFALNTGDIPLYSHGPYLSVLGHINQWLKLEGRASYRVAEYFKEENGSWTLDSSRFTVGIGVIFTPNIVVK